MNHCVPDFEMDDDYAIQNTSGSSRSKKSPMADEEIMELLWQNGQVVMHSQNQRSFRRSHIGDAVIPPDQSAATREIRPEEESATQLFIHEDEMSSWLHYPMDSSSLDRDFYSDLIYPAPRDPVAPPARTAPIPDDVRIPTPSVAASAAFRPPIPPSRRPDVESPARIQNFLHFSRAKGRTEPGPSISNRAVRASTVVDSSETPAPECRVLHAAAQVSGGNVGYGATASVAAVAGTSSAGGGERETGPCELTVTSSPGGSGASASAEPVYKQPPPPITEDRKRKGMEEADRAECQSEDADFESPDAKKQVRGSTSTKRSRAAEVHNLSERRRRDRINEKMKALQELIPRCNKSDKASMLDEAIEYLKSLQLQVQMMSMGCTMVPMMFPGVQQYMPPMGMGMGMEMGMNGPMMQFPSVLSGSAMPVPSANARLGPTFQMPAFHVQPPVPLPDQSRIQATNQSDLIHNSMGTQNPTPPRMPRFADPYQQYRSLHHMQLPLPQNQAMMQPSTIRPKSQQGSRDA